MADSKSDSTDTPAAMNPGGELVGGLGAEDPDSGWKRIQRAHAVAYLAEQLRQVSTGFRGEVCAEAVALAREADAIDAAAQREIKARLARDFHERGVGDAAEVTRAQ